MSCCAASDRWPGGVLRSPGGQVPDRAAVAPPRADGRGAASCCATKAGGRQVRRLEESGGGGGRLRCGCAAPGQRLFWAASRCAAGWCSVALFCVRRGGPMAWRRVDQRRAVTMARGREPAADGEGPEYALAMVGPGSARPSKASARACEPTSLSRGRVSRRRYRRWQPNRM